ncbi:MAG: PorV/PorQ family protein [Elusimicrobiota bacterium]
MKKFFLLVSVILICEKSLFYCSGTSTGLILSMPANGKSAGLAEACVSLSGDSAFLQYNPASLSFINQKELNLTYQKGSMDDNFGSAFFSLPSNSISFSAGVNYWTLGNMELIDMSGNIKTVNAEKDILLFAIISTRLSNVLSVGGSFKNLNSTLVEEVKAKTNAFDIGALYNFSDFPLSIGISLQSLGGKLKYGTLKESVPRTIRAGFSYILNMERGKVIPSFDIVKQNDEKLRENLGLEVALSNIFSVRAGYKFGYDLDTFTFGLGLNGRSMQLDYGWGTITDFEPKHTVSVCMKIDTMRIKKSQKLTAGENIAVADFVAKNVSSADASIVADFLRTELVKTEKFNVIEKANMDKILAEAAFQQSGCTTSECAVQIGKLLNVRQMVVGSLSKLMDTYFITVNVVNVETGKILQSESIKAYSAEELNSVCKILAQKLIE